MTHTLKSPPLFAIVVAISASIVLTGNVADAGHGGQQACHPAAKAHMNTAIRLMRIACDKPIHAAQSLARAAATHVSLAQRFTRTPAAKAELCAVEATLKHFAHGHCAPPFHATIQQTQMALGLECSLCACGQPNCRGGCSLQSRPAIEHGIGYQIDGSRTWSPAANRVEQRWPSVLEAEHGRGILERISSGVEPQDATFPPQTPASRRGATGPRGF